MYLHVIISCHQLCVYMCTCVCICLCVRAYVCMFARMRVCVRRRGVMCVYMMSGIVVLSSCVTVSCDVHRLSVLVEPPQSHCHLCSLSTTSPPQPLCELTYSTYVHTYIIHAWKHVTQPQGHTYCNVVLCML